MESKLPPSNVRYITYPPLVYMLGRIPIAMLGSIDINPISELGFNDKSLPLLLGLDQNQFNLDRVNENSTELLIWYIRSIAVP